MYYNLHLVRVYVADGVCFYLCTMYCLCRKKHFHQCLLCYYRLSWSFFSGMCVYACKVSEWVCVCVCIQDCYIYLSPLTTLNRRDLCSHHYWNGYSCASSNCMIRICKLFDQVPFWRWTQQVCFWALKKNNCECTPILLSASKKPTWTWLLWQHKHH